MWTDWLIGIDARLLHTDADTCAIFALLTFDNFDFACPLDGSERNFVNEILRNGEWIKMDYMRVLRKFRSSEDQNVSKTWHPYFKQRRLCHCTHKRSAKTVSGHPLAVHSPKSLNSHPRQPSPPAARTHSQPPRAQLDNRTQLLHYAQHAQRPANGPNSGPPWPTVHLTLTAASPRRGHHFTT